MVKLKPISILVQDCDYVYTIINGKQLYRKYLYKKGGISGYMGSSELVYIELNSHTVKDCNVWFDGDSIYLVFDVKYGLLYSIDISTDDINKLLFRFGGNVKEMIEFVLTKEFERVNNNNK